MGGRGFGLKIAVDPKLDASKLNAEAGAFGANAVRGANELNNGNAVAVVEKTIAPELNSNGPTIVDEGAAETPASLAETTEEESIAADDKSPAAAGPPAELTCRCGEDVTPA